MKERYSNLRVTLERMQLLIEDVVIDPMEAKYLGNEALCINAKNTVHEMQNLIKSLTKEIDSGD